MSIVLASTLFSLCLADLPVHCYRDTTEGDWVFTLNSETYSPGLYNSESRCGHTQPNSPEDIDSSYEFKFEESYNYNVELTAPNIAKSEQLGEGTWTL